MNHIRIGLIAIAVLVTVSVSTAAFAKEAEPTDDRGTDKAGEVRAGMPVLGTTGVKETEVNIDDGDPDFDLKTASNTDVDVEDGSGKGEKHRSAVAKAVEELLKVSDRDGGIGQEVKDIAEEQKKAHDDAADSMTRVEKRNAFITFLFGTDFGNLGALRSSLVTSENGIDRLAQAKERSNDPSVQATLDAEIQALKAENEKALEFIKEEEGKFSLFGWLVRLFSE
jgi:hypothetical protein